MKTRKELEKKLVKLLKEREVLKGKIYRIRRALMEIDQRLLFESLRHGND